MKSKDLHSSAPDAPILVLVPDSDAALRVGMPAGGGEPTLLGLGLMQRTNLAAGRAGYSQINFLVPDQVAQSAIPTIRKWSSLAAAFQQHQQAPLIIAHAAIVGETEWLKQLIATRIEPARW